MWRDHQASSLDKAWQATKECGEQEIVKVIANLTCLLVVRFAIGPNNEKGQLEPYQY